MRSRAMAPPPLKEGDRVAIVAPSSPFDLARYRRGEAWLRTKFEVLVRDDLFSRDGFLAGDDARRTRELAEAIADPSVRAIVAARGGYGATRLVEAIDWSALARWPKWLVGFSDVTALLVEAWNVGVMPAHGAMVASLGDADDGARDEWLAVLAHRGARWDSLETLVEGDIEGPAFGGNLALLEACAAAGRLRVPEGAILFFEDCTERPYRIDRMLTALHLGGHLARAAAFVVGDFTDCNAGPDGVNAEEVIARRLAAYGKPCVRGAPFGHGKVNRPFVIGATARVRAKEGSVEFDGAT